VKKRWRRFMAILALLLGAVAGAFIGILRGSLPQLDGVAQLAGLAASVSVSRDALGAPTVRAQARVDLARATGFLHAQDRFFQMDLLRRTGAGELAALLGPAALGADRHLRVHRFRSLANERYRAATPQERALLDAYAAGVNAGLDRMRSRPF